MCVYIIIYQNVQFIQKGVAEVVKVLSIRNFLIQLMSTIVAYQNWHSATNGLAVHALFFN